MLRNGAAVRYTGGSVHSLSWASEDEDPNTARMDEDEDEKKRRIRDDFLRYIPTDTPEYHYSSFDALLEATMYEYTRFVASQDCQSPYIIFTNVPAFALDEHEETLPGRHDYCHPVHLLLLTMPLPPHEVAADVFSGLLFEKARSIHVKREIAPLGASTAKANDRQKQADRSWKPN